MSFESGTINFKMFYLARQLPEDYVQRMAAHAACGLEGITQDISAGWVTGRHLLDRNITVDTISYAGYLRATLRLAQRVVPAPMLQAECRMEELAEQAATGCPFMTRRKRAEIRMAVMERMLPRQTPKLTGIPLVHQPGSICVYAGAMSNAHADMLAARWQQTMGFGLIQATPETIALKRLGVDVHDLKPVSFSAQVDDALMEVNAGRDFLTWLWFRAECGRGTVTIPDVGSIGVLLEGPLTFVHEGSGAHETVLRKGEPVGSAEARASLIAGKKLKRCRLTFGMGDELWKCGFDADEFLVRALKVPEESGNLDPASRFQSRIAQLDRFVELLQGLYGQFLICRTGPKWMETVLAMRDWTTGRSARV